MQQTGLVTGASSGIGRALAEEHAKKKRDLVVLARRKEELDDVKRELENKYGISVYVLAKDLNAPGACREVFDELKGEGITIDYLFNNAGFGGKGNFHEQEWEMIKGMIGLNITSLTELTHLFLPEMIKRGKGRILNTSSTAGFMPGPLQAVYFATKAYVNSFSNAVAYEVKDSGVTVTALCPGAVKTEFADTAGFNADSEMFAQGKSAAYTAEKGYSAMEAGKLEVISEPSLKVMIKGAMPFLPKKVGMKMIYGMQKE